MQGRLSAHATVLWELLGELSVEPRTDLPTQDLGLFFSVGLRKWVASPKLFAEMIQQRLSQVICCADN